MPLTLELSFDSFRALVFVILSIKLHDAVELLLLGHLSLGYFVSESACILNFPLHLYLLVVKEFDSVFHR